MKTSEFEKELKKLGYDFNGILVSATSFDDPAKWVAKVDSKVQGEIDWDWNFADGDKFNLGLFNLINRYASTPIEERKDKPKLFNVQIIKGKWGRESWLYRSNGSECIFMASDEYNTDHNQQWTLEQLIEHGFDDESVYKRVPVED